MVVLAYATCALIWGTTWLAIRICIGPGGYDTLAALALRFLIASAVLLPIAWRFATKPSRQQWPWLVAAGVLDAAAYAMVYVGEQHVTGGVASVIYGTQPFVLAGLMAVTKHERMYRRDLIGAVIAMLGVAIMFVDSLALSLSQAVAVLLVFGSVVCATVYSYLVKRYATGVHPLTATTVFLAVTAACITVVAVVAGASFAIPAAAAPTVALLYLALAGSVVAFFLYFWLLARVSMKAMSLLVFLFPIIALIADAIGEAQSTLGWSQAVGTAIIFAGMAVGLLGGKPS